ncbi:MAG TPA: glycoside hydrolase family 3 N-terminal domain-containing protein [Thermoleophilaceae bacterium]|nr:glycoside hydrolase family 3 N-terminal domain-containing protein [Thermoleophilaceae bacterium]
MTALRRLPRWLSAVLEGARTRVVALDAGGRRRLAAAAVAALALVVVLVAVLGQGPSRAGERSRDSWLARLVPAPEQFARRVTPATHRAARGLSVEEKVDQLMLLGFEGTGADDTARLVPRGEAGGVVVTEENYLGARELRRVIEGTHRRARRAGHVSPLFLVSQEGGELSALADLPPELAPADTASVEDAGEEALASARALKRIGLDGVLGPLLDIGAAEGGPLGLRPFSDDPREIARYARATVSAYVGAGLVSAPLHFPGLGGAATSTDEGPAQVGQTIDALRRADLLPFRVAIDAGAQAIVVGHGLYGTDDFAVPASASRFLLTDLLRGELGFEGLAIADDLAARAITITQSSSEAAVASVAAGADMARLSGPAHEQRRMRTALLAAVRSGRISRARLDAAVMRVLELKRAAGLLRGEETGAANAARERARRGERRREDARARSPDDGLAAREGRLPQPGRGGQPPAATPPPPARSQPPPAPAARPEPPAQGPFAPRPEPQPRGPQPRPAPAPGVGRREGRPPGPGGGWPPEGSQASEASDSAAAREPREYPEASTPGIGEREGRPAGPGGVRQRDLARARRERRQRRADASEAAKPTAPQGQAVAGASPAAPATSGGTTTYTVPVP